MITALIVLFGAVVYVLIRNNHVHSFRLKIIDMVYDPPGDWRKRRQVFQSVPYERMLFQLWKPLRLENFYTQDEIQILNNKQ